jgi:hypothetical protein
MPKKKIILKPGLLKQPTRYKATDPITGISVTSSTRFGAEIKLKNTAGVKKSSFPFSIKKV